MAARANTTNSLGIGVSQVAGGNVATPGTFVTTFPRAAGAAITVATARQGTTVGDTVERDSDGAFWDVTAGVPCRPEDTNIPTPGLNDMLSN
jgi:hypothetical protein